MGYYFDWVNGKWQEKSRGRRRHPRFTAREALLPGLIDEIENGDSETKLYAGLLARSIVVWDEQLMRAFGKQVARVTGEKVPPD
jgi:hypothetical protein